jgi:hypothetical protein
MNESRGEAEVRWDDLGRKVGGVVLQRGRGRQSGERPVEFIEVRFLCLMSCTYSLHE